MPDAPEAPFDPVSGGPPMRDDTALVEACLGGDQRAWRELVMRYSRLVYSVPRRYGLDEETAEDVFQEVFAILVRKLPGLRNRSGLPKWLITTAHRVSRTYRTRFRGPGPAVEMLERSSPPEDALVRWERQHALGHALEQLGERCRELLEALYAGRSEASYEQVAARLGIPVGSIGPTRARCLQRLLEILRSAEGD